jgi:hypothetical protein
LFDFLKKRRVFSKIWGLINQQCRGLFSACINFELAVYLFRSDTLRKQGVVGFLCLLWLIISNCIIWSTLFLPIIHSCNIYCLAPLYISWVLYCPFCLRFLPIYMMSITTNTTFKSLKKLNKKLVKTQHRISNCSAYLKHNVVPKGFNIKLTPNIGNISGRFLKLPEEEKGFLENLRFN